MAKVHETMVFKTVVIRQRRTVVSERREINKVRAKIVPTLLREFNSQRKKQGRAHWTPKVEEIK